MFKAAIDERIKDDTLDMFRRTIAEMREHMAEERGYARGRADTYGDAHQEGYNRAIADMLELILDFAKGNRS